MRTFKIELTAKEVKQLLFELGHFVEHRDEPVFKEDWPVVRRIIGKIEGALNAHNR